MANKNTIHISATGQFSKVNINSTDNSVTNVSYNNQIEIFDKLFASANTLVAGKEEAITAIEELKSAVLEQNKPSIGKKLIKFMEIASNAGTVLLQHIPRLSSLIQEVLAR